MSSPVGRSIESQRRQLELMFRSLQEKIQVTNSTYDGLISKRRNAIYHNYMNDATLNKVLKLIDKDDKGAISFQFVTSITCTSLMRGQQPLV